MKLKVMSVFLLFILFMSNAYPKKNFYSIPDVEFRRGNILLKNGKSYHGQNIEIIDSTVYFKEHVIEREIPLSQVNQITIPKSTLRWGGCLVGALSAQLLIQSTIDKYKQETGVELETIKGGVLIVTLGCALVGGMVGDLYVFEWETVYSASVLSNSNRKVELSYLLPSGDP